MPFYAQALTPPHLTQRLSPANKEKLRSHYRFLKKNGIKAGFGLYTGVGASKILWDASKGELITYGKRKIAAAIALASASAFSGSVVMLTNVTKVAKIANATHKTCAAAYRVAHNVAEFPIVLCDYALFGEYVSTCDENDYNLFNFSGDGTEDIFSD